MHIVRSTRSTRSPHATRGLTGLGATLAVMLATFACSSSGESVYVPASLFPAAYAQALCSSLHHCCDENAVAYDDAACTSGWKAYVSEIFSDGAAHYDPRSATDCIRLLTSAATSTCADAPGSIPDARDTCQAIFQGMQQIGEPCARDSDCAPGDGGPVTCSALGINQGDGGLLPLDLPLVEGVCTLGAAAAAGDPCANGNATACGTDGSLFRDPTTFTCSAVGTAGSPCAPRVPASCGPGTYCVNGGPDDSLCAAVLPVGSACAGADECDPTGICDLQATMTCIARKAPGTACASADECTSGACDATKKTCLVNTIGTTAACMGAGP